MASSCRRFSALRLELSLPNPLSHLPIFPLRTYLTLNPISLQCPDQPQNHSTHPLSDHPNPEISSFPQKGFSQITQETSGKSLHALCLKGIIPLRAFCSNTLVNMYSKFGRIGYARSVFGEMPDRNEASWNTMMSSYVRVGLYNESVRFFSEMVGSGVRPSGFVIASLVTACDKSGSMFKEGMQVHGFVVKIGLLCDVYVGTSVLHLYGGYGVVGDVRKVFEEMPARNVVTWTSLIVGYSSGGDLGEVMRIYKDMRREGVCCNENTLAVVFSSCGGLGDELLGEQVLGDVGETWVVGWYVCWELAGFNVW